MDFSHNSLLRFLVAGKLQREFILTPEGRAHLDISGGNVLYAAAGLALWDKEIGILSRIGEDYPQEWLDEIKKLGLDCSGVHVLPQSLDLRSFYGYLDEDTRKIDNPIAHFSRLGIKYPKSLLGYTPQPTVDSHTMATTYTLQLSDIPAGYYDATAAHLCPLDYLSHHLIPSRLQQGHISTITIDPSSTYMNSSFWDDVHLLVKDITAFMPSEEEIRHLFQGRSDNLWEMAEELGDCGCEFVIIKRGARGQYLYIHADRSHWEIPAYPVQVYDPTGAGSSFCGGFLAGYRSSYDPLEAMIYGNISASFTVEGTGPFFPLHALSGLPAARLDTLRQKVKKN